MSRHEIRGVGNVAFAIVDLKRPTEVLRLTAVGSVAIIEGVVVDPYVGSAAQ
jgi:hypothetical protein